jgi:hypothetical protein
MVCFLLQSRLFDAGFKRPESHVASIRLHAAEDAMYKPARGAAGFVVFLVEGLVFAFTSFAR